MKYIAYCRKSTDEKDRQILSIEAQIAEIREYADREGLEIVEFIEEAKTAKEPGREQFGKVIKMLEKNQADGIVSWHPDRLARNSIDGGRIIHLLDTGKLLDLKFPTFWFDNTPQGKFMLGMAFNQSKYYVDNLSENVKRGLRQKLRNGVFPGKAPWGYKNNIEKGTIEVHEEHSRILKKAFEKFADGNMGFTDVSRFLYKNGMKSKLGKPFKIDRVRTILQNKFYIGIIFYAGEYYEGTHNVFIKREIFDRVQKQFNVISKPKYNKHNLNFLGLIRCAECGGCITGEKKFKFYKNTRGRVEYTYYRCTKKLGPCSQKFIPEDKLEEQLRKAILDVSIPQDWADDWYKWLEQDEAEEKVNRGENLIRLETEIKTIEEKLNTLLDSYLDNVIDAQDYKHKKNELFDLKLKKTQDITKIKAGEETWLEPFREWVGSALSCAKIARAKNSDPELKEMAKTVGSDFFLSNRQLEVHYNQGFATIHDLSIAKPKSPGLPTITQRERGTRIELASLPWEGSILPVY